MLKNPAGIFRRALAPMLPVILILAAYWKLTTMQGYLATDDIFTSDFLNAHLPYFHFIGASLKSGHLPLWMPSIYGGYPFFAGGAGTWYPFNTVLLALLPTMAAANLILLSTLAVTALGMYYYVREIGANIPGSMIAAVAFSFSGFMISHLKHVTMVESVCWFPLGLLLLERGITRARGGNRSGSARAMLGLGVVFALQHLSGFTQTAFYSDIVYVAYFVLRVLHTAGDRSPRPEKPAGRLRVFLSQPVLLWFLVALAAGVALSAIHILPAYEHVADSQRSGGVAFSYAANYAYDPSNIKTFVYPFANGDIGDGTYRGNSIFWEDYGYVGIFTLILAFVGALRRWHSWHVKFFCATAAIAFLIVLGKNTPLYEVVFSLVPGMKYFRFPTRFLFVVDASLAILAAIGATSISAHRGSRARAEKNAPAIPAGGAVVLLLVVADLLYFQMRQNPVVDAKAWSASPAAADALQKDTTLFRIYSPGAEEAHKDAFRLARGWESSLQPYVDQREFLQVNTGELYGISSVNGYIPLAPDYVVDVWGDMNRSGIIMKTAALRNGRFVPARSFLNIMDVFNVKYILCAWPIQDSSLTPMGHFKGAFAYVNRSVLPRAFLVWDYRRAKDAEDAKSMLASDSFVPAREAILCEDPGMMGPRQGSRVAVERYAINEVVVRVETGSTGLLVLSDTDYPGWNAQIDGKDVRILRANVCQRAVVVPAGSHVVRFGFSPESFRAGAAVSIGSLLLVCGVFVGLRRRAV